MMSVKLVRSLVLGETINNPFQFQSQLTNTIHHDHDLGIHNDLDCDHHHEFHHHKGKKRLPILLFTPTKELISDTFRLATIARDIGMDFCPNSSLSHLLFSWPTPHPPPSSSYPPSSNYRSSVSSNASTFTVASSSTAATTMAPPLQSDSVPIPFPSLSTTTSLSLLRSFISLSKGLFKLVFLDISPNSNPNFNHYHNYYHDLINYGCNYEFGLCSRVSGKRVKTMDEFSRELAAKGWAMYRSAETRKVSPFEVDKEAALLDHSVYLFRKMDPNRVRVKGMGTANGGECNRVRELRLPVLDFGKGLKLRLVLYILLMTDDVFYLA